MSKKVILVNFPMESLAYQAFSQIKQLHASSAIVGEQMAVVSHREDGSHQFDIKDFIDFTGKNHTSKNSTIGMLIGLFAGPLAMMLGWFTGGMIGNAQDVKEVKATKSIFEYMGKAIDEGETGLILIAEEEDNRPLNQLIFNELGGNIERHDFEDVLADVTEAQTLEAEVKEKND